MTIQKVFRNNLRDMFKSRLSRLILTVVVLLPLLYSGLYLWAFWNPYEHMKDMPVGLVNQDRGTDGDNYGRVLVDNLVTSRSLKWRSMNKAEAEKALKDHSIYFYLLIPGEFSSGIVSAGTKTPEQAKLEFVVNEASNVLVPQIGGRVVTEVKQKYSKEVTAKMVALLLEAGKGAAGGVIKAADGAAKLYRGSATLASGAGVIDSNMSKARAGSIQLARGLNDLHTGSSQLSDGVARVTSGAGSLKDGLSQLDSGVLRIRKGLIDGAGQVDKSVASMTLAVAGSQSLYKGAVQAAEGGARIADNMKLLTAGIQETSEGSAKLSDGLAEALVKIQKLTSNPVLKAIPEVRKLAEQAQEAAIGANQIKEALFKLSTSGSQLVEGVDKLAVAQATVATGAGKLSEGLSSAPDNLKMLSSGMEQASEGLGSVHAGVTKLEDGGNELSEGLDQLASGAGRLDSGSQKAYSASVQLSDGLGKLSVGSHTLSLGEKDLTAGAKELYDKLGEGAKMVGGLQSDPSLMGRRARVISEPVVVDTVRVNRVDTYGTGFAPYFLSLSLWVGALLMFFAVNMREPGVYLTERNKAITVYGKFLAVSIFAALQGLLSCGVVHMILGAPIRHVAAYYFIGVLSALSFTAIIYCLVSALGMAGRFAALVLLMLQLTSCGGTFPPETIPMFFRNIKPWLPMTYTVSAYKASISGLGMAESMEAVYVLAGLGLLALLVTPLFVRKTKDGNELQPAVEAVIPGLGTVEA